MTGKAQACLLCDRPLPPRRKKYCSKGCAKRKQMFEENFVPLAKTEKFGLVPEGYYWRLRVVELLVDGMGWEETAKVIAQEKGRQHIGKERVYQLAVEAGRTLRHPYFVQGKKCEKGVEPVYLWVMRRINHVKVYGLTYK